VRTIKTASGATAAQIVYFSDRGSRDIEHIGSADDDAGMEGNGLAGRVDDGRTPCCWHVLESAA